MLQRFVRGGFGAFLLVTLFSAGAFGQRIIINPPPIGHDDPPPGLRPPGLRPPIHPVPRPIPPPIRPIRDARLNLKSHNVSVSIVDGVAVTGIDQVFFNPYDAVVEGTYIFPLDDDVAVSRFTMYVNGEEIEGKLLGVDEARREYESIVARMRDPALLEYLGTRMFRARVFPINPKTEVRVKLSYTQMLSADAGLVRYRYPLKADGSHASPIENLSLSVNVESKTPIKSVFSPTHTLAIGRSSDHKASASFEGKNVTPDRNFELYYSLGDKEFGMTVLTYREGGKDGFFLVRISPPAKTSAGDVLPKDIAFVIDTSGSMSGEKIEQARNALRFCLDNLNKDDAFNIIPFSHEAATFRDTLVTATPENVAAARQFVDGLQAAGGTNINDALLKAITTVPHRETDRPYLIVFLTDGQPTVGVIDAKDILRNVSSRNDGRIRLFVFGVGYDVNTQLLDLLAEQNRGARDYVEPGESLELTLSGFYRKVAEPVLANLSLSFGDVNVYDLFPSKLGDLFAGGEVVVTGRYKGVGTKSVELTGTRRGKLERFVDETQFVSESRTHDFLPRLWATRNVGFLLDEIRLHGENAELKQTVVQLATEYGIVTPYTAYLVTEPGQVAINQGRGGNVMEESLRRQRSFAPARRMRSADAQGVPPSPMSADGASDRSSFGIERVAESKHMIQLNSDDVSEVADLISGIWGKTDDERAAHRGPAPVQRVGQRTFYRVDDRWIDASYDKTMETTKVEAFSEAYFDLLRKHADLGKCFALGERVVVVADGKAYEIVPAPQP